MQSLLSLKYQISYVTRTSVVLFIFCKFLLAFGSILQKNMIELSTIVLFFLKLKKEIC